MEARIESNRLDREDISLDYVKVKKALEELAGKLDYGYINRIKPFDKQNPTSENIAKWFYEGLNRKPLLGNAVLREIILWEGPSNSLTYRRPA